MPDFQPAGPCPICLQPDVRQAADDSRDANHILCAACGQHLIVSSALGTLRGNFTPIERARIAHGLVKVPADYMVNSSHIEQLARNTTLPGAVECIENLVMYFAETVPIGGTLDRGADTLRAAIGAADAAAALWVVQEAINEGLLSTTNQMHIEDPATRRPLRLTAVGWARHSALMRAGARSEHAFMAMDFNDPDLQAFFTQHLQPAVLDTGFKLRTTNHPEKTAGMIDNRMRVELRTSRFVVCDLSHGNHGAYWEAGFAEGLGRPVFYICRRDAFASPDKHTRPHFDTAHQTIIQWSLDDPGKALAELKDMIRATLPAEARMEDPPAG